MLPCFSAWSIRTAGMNIEPADRSPCFNTGGRDVGSLSLAMMSLWSVAMSWEKMEVQLFFGILLESGYK